MSYIATIAASVRAAVPDDLIPSEDSDWLFLLYAVLVLTRGNATTAEDVHDAWSAWMEMRCEKHESLIPFDQLPSDVRHEDDPFVYAIRTVAAELSQ